MKLDAYKERKLTDIQEEYDRLFVEQPIRDEDRGYAWHAQTVLKYQPGVSHLLDIACGGGYFLSIFNQHAGQRAKITGMDISGEALRIARGQCPSAELLMGSAEALPFDAGQYDAITCLGSMEHFKDIPQAVSEIIRISVPHARVFILVPNMFWYRDIAAVLFSGTRVQRNQTHERFQSWGEWVEMLETAGLSVIKTLKYNGIAKSSFKQKLKDILIPTRFSYHFMFVCEVKNK